MLIYYSSVKELRSLVRSGDARKSIEPSDGDAQEPEWVLEYWAWFFTVCSFSPVFTNCHLLQWIYKKNGISQKSILTDWGARLPWGPWQVERSTKISRLSAVRKVDCWCIRLCILTDRCIIWQGFIVPCPIYNLNLSLYTMARCMCTWKGTAIRIS